MKYETNEKYPTRWDLNPLFKNTPENISKERERAKRAYQKFIKKWKNRQNYLKSPKILSGALKEYSLLQKNHPINEGYYLFLAGTKDAINPKIKAQQNKMYEFYRPLFNEIGFFFLNISKIPKKSQSKFLKSKELREYKHLLEGFFENAKYLLTESEEKILNSKAVVSHGNWVQMTSSLLAKEEKEVLDENGKSVKLPMARLSSLVRSKNKKVRDGAAKALCEIFKKHADVSESEFNSILQNKRIDDDLRKYTRPEKARHISDDMDSKVVDALTDRVSKNFHISRDLYKFRSQILKLKKPHYYERNIPIEKKSTKKFSYNESVSIVKNALGRLDPEFEKIFMDFVNGGFIDVYSQKGKENGAYCAYGSKDQPIYIFLNHNGEVRDVLTIAHEVGHGINNVLIRKNENDLNTGNSTAVAEISSTFMEDFTLDEISKDLNDEEKFYLLIKKLDDSVATIFRQIAAYRFEQELHQKAREKGYLDKKEIGGIFKKHMLDYIGKDTVMKDGEEYSWVSWSHFRRFFYVYTYASGLLISKYFQRQTRKDPKFIKKVKKFLSTGSSKSPKDILKEMGVDITKAKFWDDGLKEIEKDLKEAKRLAKKLGKI